MIMSNNKKGPMSLVQGAKISKGNVSSQTEAAGLSATEATVTMTNRMDTSGSVDHQATEIEFKGEQQDTQLDNSENLENKESNNENSLFDINSCATSDSNKSYNQTTFETENYEGEPNIKRQKLSEQDTQPESKNEETTQNNTISNTKIDEGDNESTNTESNENSNPSLNNNSKDKEVNQSFEEEKAKKFLASYERALGYIQSLDARDPSTITPQDKILRRKSLKTIRSYEAKFGIERGIIENHENVDANNDEKKEHQNKEKNNDSEQKSSEKSNVFAPKTLEQQNKKSVTKDVVSTKQIFLFLPNSAYDKTDKILIFLKHQNNINVDKWRKLQRTNENSHALIKFLIDQQSADKLIEKKCELYYRFRQIKVEFT